jgi:hypothetical protein
VKAGRAGHALHGTTALQCHRDMTPPVGLSL